MLMFRSKSMILC